MAQLGPVWPTSQANWDNWDNWISVWSSLQKLCKQSGSLAELWK